MNRKQKVKEIVDMSLGVFLVTIGYYFFFSPANLVTGGVTGLSIVYKEFFKAPQLSVSIFIYTANIILLIIGGLVLGKQFFFKTIYGTLLLPTLITIYSLIGIQDNIIYSKLGDSNLIIACIIGSLLTGMGLGMVFRNNATTGGTDVVQKLLYHKLKVPYSVAVYITDGIVVGLGLLASTITFGFGHGLEVTFFAIASVILVGFTIDRVTLSGRSGYTLFIVSNEYTIMKEAIYKQIDRGVTKVSVVGGYSETEKNMIICTISQNQLYDIKMIIETIDPHAFTFITRTIESVGKGFSK